MILVSLFASGLAEDQLVILHPRVSAAKSE